MDNVAAFRFGNHHSQVFQSCNGSACACSQIELSIRILNARAVLPKETDLFARVEQVRLWQQAKAIVLEQPLVKEREKLKQDDQTTERANE